MNVLIKNELEALQDDDGFWRVEKIVRWAMVHKDSRLHNEFNWNVKEAAREHWLETARRLLRIHVVYETGERKLVSLSIDRSKDGGGYRSIDRIVDVPDLMEILLSDALRELERVRLKYERVKALSPVWRAIEKVAVVKKKKPPHEGARAS